MPIHAWGRVALGLSLALSPLQTEAGKLSCCFSHLTPAKTQMSCGTVTDWREWSNKISDLGCARSEVYKTKQVPMKDTHKKTKTIKWSISRYQMRAGAKETHTFMFCLPPLCPLSLWPSAWKFCHLSSSPAEMTPEGNVILLVTSAF